MDERKAKLAERLVQSRQDLMTTLGGMPSSELAQRAVNDGWAVQDVVAHLASAERGHQDVITALLAGEDTHQPGFDLDVFNEREVGARRAMTMEEVFAELESSRAATLALLNEVGVDDWDRSGYHPGGFETTVEGSFRVIAIHEKRHAREIRGALNSQ